MKTPETSGRSTTDSPPPPEVRDGADLPADQGVDETDAGEADAIEADGAETDAGEHDRRRRSFWREFPVLVVAAFALALLIKTFLLQAFYIPSGSMIPTLEVGERILVEKVGYRFGEPERGDVVVFERSAVAPVSPAEEDSVLDDVANAFKSLFGFPTGGEQDFVKRVIAVGGDTIEGRDGLVRVNDEVVDEPYLPSGAVTNDFPPQRIPPGQIFVMGDNRGNSDDSRNFGPVPADEVVGRAFVSIWPPKDFGSL